MSKQISARPAFQPGPSEAPSPKVSGLPLTARHATKPVKSREDMLFKVELALARLENGDYGYCVICQSAIPIEDLEKDPSTVSCQSCQTKEN